MIKIRTILLISMLLFVAVTCRAAELEAPKSANIQIGALQVHPSIGIGATYSDNIYQSYDAKDKDKDFIMTISPGISLFVPIRRHSVQLGYKADIYKFADFKENDYVNQTLAGLVNFDFPGGLLFSISDAFKSVTNPRKWKEQTGVSGASDPYREKAHLNNDVKVMAKYSFADRWTLEARYSNYLDRYDKDYDNESDFNRNMFGGSMYYRFTPKTSIVLDYDFSDVNYDHNDQYDNYNHVSYIGLSFDPTAKIQGYAKVGYVLKKYKNAIPSKDDDTVSAFSALVDLAYIVTSYDKMRLSAIRMIQEDVDTFGSYTNTDITFEWKHVFSLNEKISMTPFVGFQRYDYDTASMDVDGTIKTREDSIWKAGVGFNYMVQPWLELSLNYGYKNDASNFKRYNYDENRVFLSATFQY